MELRTCAIGATSLQPALVLSHDGFAQLPQHPLAVDQGGTNNRSLPTLPWPDTTAPGGAWPLDALLMSNGSTVRAHSINGMGWGTWGGGSADMVSISYGDFASYIQFYKGGGTAASPGPVPDGMILASLEFFGYGTDRWVADVVGGCSAMFSARSTQAWTNTQAGSRFDWQVTPNGSITRRMAMILDHDGSLQLPLTGSRLTVGQPGGPAVAAPDGTINVSGGFYVNGVPIGAGASVPPDHGWDEGALVIAKNNALRSSPQFGFGGDDPGMSVLVGWLSTNTPDDCAGYLLQRARGTDTNPTGVLNNDMLGRIFFFGYSPTPPVGWNDLAAAIVVRAAENWTATSHAGRLNFLVTPSGQIQSNLVMSLLGDGTVQLPAKPLDLNQGGTGTRTLTNWAAPPQSAQGRGDGALLMTNGTSVFPAGSATTLLSGWGAAGGAVFTATHAANGRGNVGIEVAHVRGTLAAPAALLNDDWLGSVWYSGHDGTAIVEGATIAARTTQNWTATAHGAAIEFTTTPNGAAARRQAMVLDGFANLSLYGWDTPPPTGRRDVGFNVQGNTAFGAPIFWGLGYRGTGAAPTLPLQTDILLWLGGGGAAANANAWGAISVAVPPNQGNWTATSQPTELLFETTPVNATAGQYRMKLRHTGRLDLNPGEDVIPDDNGGGLLSIMGANAANAAAVVTTIGVGTPRLVTRGAGGTRAAMTVSPVDGALGQWNAQGWDGTAFQPGALISAFANTAWSATNRSSRLVFSTVANGTTAAVARVTIAHDGNVGINTGGAALAPYSLTGLLIQGPDNPATVPGLQISRYGGGAGLQVRFQQAGGTRAAPTATQNNDILGDIFALGFGTAFGRGAIIRMIAEETWTATANGAGIQIIVNPLGTVLTRTSVFHGNGSLIMSGATGGDTSEGTVNARGYYLNGVQQLGGVWSVDSPGRMIGKFSPAGTTPPAPGVQGIQIIGNAAAQPGVDILAYGGTVTFITRYANGTPAAPTAVPNATRLAQWICQGHIGTGFGGNTGIIDFATTQAWTATAQGTALELRTTLNGQTTNNITMALNQGGLGGVTVPSTVTGGDLGAGTINVSGGYYVNGVRMAAPVIPSDYNWEIGAIVAAKAGALASAHTFGLVANALVCNFALLPVPPGRALQGAQFVGTAGIQAGWQSNNFGATATFVTQVANGTPTGPTAIPASFRMSQWIVNGFNGLGYSPNVGIIDFVSTQAWDTFGNNGIGLEFRTTLNGSTGNNVTMAISIGGAGGVTVPGIVTGGDRGTGTINVGSGIYLSGIAYGAPSDPLLKSEIKIAPRGALAQVQKVPVIHYHWADGRDKGRHIGFNAVDVQEVLGEDIGCTEEGNRNYSLPEVVATLWQAVQELTAEVHQLRRVRRPNG
jgi:hypothetical protein